MNSSSQSTALYLALVIAAALVPIFVTQTYTLFIVDLALIGAILATGLNVANGYAGLLNLPVAGQLALGAYTCALLASKGTSVPVAIASGVLVGALIAGITFLLLARLTGFFFGLATIAVSEIVRLLIRNLDGLTNGVRGLRGFPPLSATPASGYWVLLAILVVVLMGVAVLVRSPVGLIWGAIRDNPVKARSLGVPVRAYQLLAFTLSGALMSLGGALLALQLQYIEPGIAGLNNLVQTILMMALGGAGTLLGPVFGAFVITIVPETLRAANELRLVLYGLTLVAVVLLVPGGVFGMIKERLHLRRMRHRHLVREGAPH